MAKRKKEEALNLDHILFKCRDILRNARNSGSFFEKRDLMLTLVFLRFIGEKFEDGVAKLKEKLREQGLDWIDYATPPASNANYAWILHILHHLKPLTGVAGFLLSNGALADSDAKEIRQKLIENDKIEAIVILPRELFITTDISVTLWILNQNKRGGDYHGRNLRNRTGEILFMDLRNWRKNAVKNEGKKKVMLDSRQIEKAAHIYHTWQEIGTVGFDYAEPELYRGVELSEIAANNYSLVPSNYIEFIDHDLDIDYPAEMAKVQERMKTLISRERKSQEKLLAAFKGIGYGIE